MIRADELRKEYHMGGVVVRALDGVTLSIERGEFVSIIGASGSGKSTLMHILGCLDRPTGGSLEFQGHLIGSMKEKRLAELRNRHIGFVFQTFNLINRTSALDNVVVPLVYTRRSFAKGQARQALEKVGLLHRAKHRPGEMSGGECQRVAIARAIVNNPALLLADEPTGNLDSRTGDQIMQVFHDLHGDGMTIIVVTHEMDIAAQADRIIHMRDGKIIEDTAVDDRRRQQILAGAQENYRKMFEQKSTGRRPTRPVKPLPTPDAERELRLANGE